MPLSAIRSRRQLPALATFVTRRGCSFNSVARPVDRKTLDNTARSLPCQKMSTKTTLNPLPFVSHPTPERRLLVLASTSRYRRALLAQLGLPFAIAAPDTDEAAWPGESPAATALRLAEAKARSVAARHPGALIIGSDQVADCEGRAIGKPESHDDAVAQLTALSGKTVVFHTGLALLDAATGHCQTAMVDVRSTFRRLAPAEIETYLRRDQPYDCAASVKSDALGIALFERIDSDDPTALIGLPLIRLTDMLRVAGVAVLEPSASRGSAARDAS